MSEMIAWFVFNSIDVMLTYKRCWKLLYGVRNNDRSFGRRKTVLSCVNDWPAIAASATNTIKIHTENGEIRKLVLRLSIATAWNRNTTVLIELFHKTWFQILTRIKSSANASELLWIGVFVNWTLLFVFKSMPCKNGKCCNVLSAFGNMIASGFDGMCSMGMEASQASIHHEHNWITQIARALKDTILYSNSATLSQSFNAI